LKLDKDLVRDVLLKLEADEGDPRNSKDIEVAGFPREQISYTIQKLSEAGLVDAISFSSSSGYDWRARALTYEGHEFLDTIRDGKIWKETKRIANEAGVFTLRALMETAKAVVKSELTKHGVHLP
jgi:hypothetical protein